MIQLVESDFYELLPKMVDGEVLIFALHRWLTGATKI
jgi:hypothetical protein